MEENSKTVFAENFHEHQDFAARNAELENLVADRNMKIKNLEVQLGICKKIITQHHQCSNGHDMEQADFTCKLQQALEARDELKFTVTQLQKELEEFRNKPKATLVYEIRVLRAMVADSEDQLKQCQEKLIDSQKALILAEAALTEEQKNTKLMRRICESEKDKVMRELQTVQDALMNLQEEYDRKKEEIEMKEDEMEGFKTRRDAQFETYENLPKHERGLREREQREVHQIQNVLRTLTPQKNEQLFCFWSLKTTMATSDSEDFESADEELEEGTEILKDKSVKNSKSEAAVKTHSADKLTTLASGDSNTKVKVDDVAQSLEKSACLEEIRSIKNNSDEPIYKSEVDKIISQSEAHFHEESDLKIEGEGRKLVTDAGGDGGKTSDSKEETQSLKEDVDVLPCDEETDGWDCEDEDVNEQLIEENTRKLNFDTALNKLAESVEKEQPNSKDGGDDSGGSSSTWGSWGSWGVTSLLSTATESVSTLTNQVSQGLSTVLETGLGVPDAEELVRQEIEQEKKYLVAAKEKSELNAEEKIGKENVDEKREEDSLFGFGRVISGVSSITKLVETASTKVVSGGLGTLETIGKKTMEVLQEGDPGLRKKRALFSDKVVLSQVLREAKDKAEQEDRALKNTEDARKVHFETLFDDFHGLVHLEALEMLSKQCNIKLQSVLLNTPSENVPEHQESIGKIKDVCELPDEDEAEGASFETLKIRLVDVGKGLGVPVASEKLVKTWEEVKQWLQECRRKQTLTAEEVDENPENVAPTAREIHQKAIAALARLTAEAVEQFHKTAELLLVYEKRNPMEEARILLDMTSIFSLQVSTASTVFSENLNTCSEYAENSDVVNSHITNVFLEAANSSSYIQEAFQLLIPVLQVGIVSS